MNQTTNQTALASAASKELTARTHQLITDFYHKKSGTFVAVLHPDVLWIGAADSQYLKGYEEVYQYLEELTADLPACDMDACHYDTIYAGDSMCIITGQFTGHTAPGSSECFAGKQRLTFIWKLFKGGWRLFHMHLSNPMANQEKEELFPHNAGRQTYQYVKKLLGEQSAAGKTISFHGCGGETLLLPPNEILYIEAANINCLIYSVGSPKPAVIRYPISNLVSSLPSNFVQIHRSYIVNRNLVTAICRYYVRLRTGVTLPIPEKKFRDVSEMLQKDLT